MNPSELIASLRAESDELIKYQFSHTKEAMSCLQRLHDLSLEAADALQAMERVPMTWQPIETAPKTGEFLLGVWEGDWNNPKQTFRIYHATGYAQGPSWAMQGHYRTEEGGAYKLAGWMPLPTPPESI